MSSTRDNALQFIRNDDWNDDTRPWLILFSLIFLVYVALRLIGFSTVSVFEDHDSIRYLTETQALLRDGFSAVFQFTPDMTPFYPFTSAMFSLPGLSADTGARLCSLFFSMCLFFALLGIARQALSPVEAAIGLLIVAFNPFLIRLSYSILTEPSFIALAYIAFCLFWMNFKEPKLWQAAALGLVAGLAFLNRVEGVLYLAFFPALQFLHFLFFSDNQYTLKRLALWSGVFAAVFISLATPQVWLISDKMGQFSLNGRQAWGTILGSQDGKSYEQKIYGLDHSPGEINLRYLQKNPDLLKRSDAKPNLVHHAKVITNNFDDLYSRKLGLLVGPIGIALFCFGLLALWMRGQRFDVVLVGAIIAVGIAAPLLHNVVLRHVAIIAPIVFLVGGAGVVSVSRTLVGSDFRSNTKAARNYAIVTAALVLAVLAVWSLPLGKLLAGNDPMQARFSPAAGELRKAVGIVREFANRHPGKTPMVVARRQYFRYIAGATGISLPYTDYDGLLRYGTLNNADFLYLDYGDKDGKRPFIETFSRSSPPRDFELLFRGTNSRGSKIELYRFRRLEEPQT